MLRTLAAEAARRFGQRMAFAAVRPAELPQQAAEPADSWQLSYADLDRLSDETAAGLAFRGVLPGDVVALALPTVPEFPVCYLAAVKIGAVAAGVDPRWPPAVLDRLSNLLRPTVTMAPFGLDIGPGPDGDLIRIALASSAKAALAGFRRAEPPPPPLPPDAARPAVIAFTSGRTGLPRGAVFGVSQLDAIRAAEAGEMWGSAVGNVVLAGIPPAHYRFMTRLPAMLQSGQSCVLMASWRPQWVLDVAAMVRATELTGLPAQLAKLVEDSPVGAASPAGGPAGLPYLKLISTGDAAVPAGLLAALRQRFRAGVQVRYGCAEAGLGLSVCLEDAAADAAAGADGCAGIPAPGVTVALRDAGGRDVPGGEFGEVLLRSAACMSGYWNDPQASTAAFTSDHFVRTGDRGRLDDEGRLFLAGYIGPG
jgi:acyl-CoA synthetase (AMP-forming)/AMP-acid ligase II